jgi:hypothetical protein
METSFSLHVCKYTQSMFVMPELVCAERGKHNMAPEPI